MYGKLKSLYTLYFGPLETFEGDTIHVLLHLSTLLNRNKWQFLICKAITVLIAANILEFLYYLLFLKPEKYEFMGFMTMQVTALHFFVGYCLLLANNKIYVELTQSFLRNSRPIATGSDKVIRNIKEESRLAVKFGLVFVVGIVTNATLFLPWTGDEEKIIFLQNRAKMYFGDNIFVEMSLFPVFYHAGYIVSTPMFLIIYYMLHIKFQFALLIEKVEGLNLSANKNIPELALYDVNCQKEIRKQLISCIQHHQCIKRFKNTLSQTFYWPTFCLASSVVLFETSLIVFCLSKISPPSNYRMIYTWCLTTLGHTVYALVGQTIVDESEKIYTLLKCCNWYKWDKKNRDLMRIFLIHTQQPMTISSSGIIIVSKELILKSYKALYSLITFYQSMSARN